MQSSDVLHSLAFVLFFMGFTLFMWEGCPVAEDPVEPAQRKEQHSSSVLLLGSGATRAFLLLVCLKKTHFLDIEREMAFSTLCTEKPLRPQ